MIDRYLLYLGRYSIYFDRYLLYPLHSVNIFITVLKLTKIFLKFLWGIFDRNDKRVLTSNELIKNSMDILKG